jgi:hypothetical protein
LIPSTFASTADHPVRNPICHDCGEFRMRVQGYTGIGMILKTVSRTKLGFYLDCCKRRAYLS